MKMQDEYIAELKCVINDLKNENKELRKATKKRSSPDLDKAYDNYLKSVEAVNAELKELRAYKQRVRAAYLKLEEKCLSEGEFIYLFDEIRTAIMGNEVDA